MTIGATCIWLEKLWLGHLSGRRHLLEPAPGRPTSCPSQTLGELDVIGRT